MSNCIYCGTTTDLVAQLTITIDGDQKITVDICNEHSEDATIRTARQKYMERQSQIDELMAKAKMLGLELAPQQTPGGLVILQSAPKEVPQQPQPIQARPIQPRQQVVVASDDDDGMIDSTIVDQKERRTIVSRGGVAGSHSIESHRSLDMTDIQERIGDDVLHGKVKMETIERQSGGYVSIPAKKVNGLGTTNVVVVQTTDQEMQRRFKQQADQSKSDNGWNSMRHLGKEGIEIINCPICKGEGVARNAGKEITCPKCKGKGHID